MAVIWLSVVLATLVKNAASEYNPAFCSMNKKSSGLIPPPLPMDFAMKFEHVDHIQRFSSYEEMYFDHSNSRAKYQFLRNSTEYHYLFDFLTDQIVGWMKIRPGVSMKRDPLSQECVAEDMEESEYFNLFGYSSGAGVKQFNSYEMLRYGTPYMYAANGTEILYERNLAVNNFISCFYDKYFKATVLSKYYFANTTNVQPSGGTQASVVGLTEEDPLSVPMKLHITGDNSADNKNVSLFNKTINISWFKGNPIFRRETFQIPPWIHCEEYGGRKSIPELPRAFSTRLTRTWFSLNLYDQLEPKFSGESYEVIFYDFNRKLARRDFSPTASDSDIYAKFQSTTPVRTIYDFNQGLKYTTNIASGRCYVVPIPLNDPFDKEGDLLFSEMATPQEIFLMQMDDMQYKGQAFARDVECDVYNGRHYHAMYDATLIKETYFSTNAWHENTEGVVERHVPVKHVMIREDLDNDDLKGVSTFNFLKFNSRPPKMTNFDLKSCIDLIVHKRFAILLTLTEETLVSVFDYQIAFLEAAQLYIANQTKVNTPLRVQRPHLIQQPSNNPPRIFLVFSLLDKVAMEDYPTYGQKGTSLPQAIVLLQTLVEAGNFSVEFRNPVNPEEKITVNAARGNLYSVTADGNLSSPPLRPKKLRNTEKDGDSTDVEGPEEKGMTGGHLALLSFAMMFIGIGIGIALMYLYLRIYAERYVEDRIDLTTSASSGEHKL